MRKLVIHCLILTCALLTLCVSLQEFAEDRAHFLPPWVLYFSGCEERDRLLAELSQAWTTVYQVNKTQTYLQRFFYFK